MAKRIRFCPKCMNIIHKNDTVCSSCGLEVDKMQQLALEKEEEKKKLIQEKIGEPEPEVTNASDLYGEIKIISNQPQEDVNGQAETTVEQQIKVVSNLEENVEQTDDGAKTEDLTTGEEQRNYAPKRHKHKAKKVREEDVPKFSVDENGQYDINTKDVTFLEDIDYKSYSKKQARGEKPAREKIEWWEIYKWADLFLARRKINKEVKKASYKIPYGVTKAGMLLWCIFFGWLGIHNFYAKNNKKGWTVVSFCVIVGIVINVPVLYEIMGIFVGGGLGFVVMAMWLTDLYGIITNHYQYRISKEEFISNLNVSTRGKLAKRYWKLDRPTFLAKEQKRIDKIVAKRNKKHKIKKSQNSETGNSEQ